MATKKKQFKFQKPTTSFTTTAGEEIKINAEAYTLEEWEEYMIYLNHIRTLGKSECIVYKEDGESIYRPHAAPFNDEEYRNLRNEIFRVSEIIRVLKHRVETGEIPEIS